MNQRRNVMTAPFWVAIIVALAVIAEPARGAERKAAAAPAAAETIRYVVLSGSLDDGREVEGFVREARARSKLMSATVDLCHRVAPASERWDRTVIEAKPEGAGLRGTGLSQVDRRAIEVRLQRTASGGSVRYDGTIRRDGTEMKLTTEPSPELDENGFREEQEAAGAVLVERPEDFLEVSAESIGIRVRSDAMDRVLDSLRGEPVELSSSALAADCMVLRTGVHTLTAAADPEMAGALVARLRGVEGVLMAGWQAEENDPSNAIRMGAEGHRSSDGRIDAGALLAAAAAAAAQVIAPAALHGTPKREPTTGEYTMVLKRPSALGRGAALSEEIELTLQVVPEKPDAKDKIIVFVGTPAITLKDDRDGPRLAFGKDGVIAGTDPRLGAWTEAIVAGLARKLGGRRSRPDLTP
jgi:hypothetical protein